MKEVLTDIIVPIYNAYDAAKECVASVILSTDLNTNSLVLINDCSPDERIDSLLSDFKNANPQLNIHILKNENNLGFVGTVNRGMSFSRNDVLLLNSDTVVSRGWLEKIKDCAYSGKNIGTVTPLSNNATLVSVPNGICRNEVREDISLEEYNTLIEKCSYKEYPELPTAHGFCMYIKREVLDLVGFFDEKSFGKGYGEENDFSFRILDYGYRNILCDTTLVYHKESQSFNKERDEVLQGHLEIIRNRYPQYSYLIDTWCRMFPIKHICENIRINLEIKDRKNVLLLIHEFENTCGGTTLHLLDIVKSLRSKMNLHVLYPVGDKYVLHSFFKDSEYKLVLPYTVNKLSNYQRRNSVYRTMIKEVMLAFGIDTIHIHHMVGHFFDALDIAKELGIYSLITLHDYYCICPNHNLLYCKEEYCRTKENPDCKKCLNASNITTYDITKVWRKEWQEFLSGFDKVIVPSEDAKKIVSAYYKNINIESIEHGVEMVKSDYVPQMGDTFNVAFIGVLCKHKGGYIANEIIKRCKGGNIHFHAFGKSEIPELMQDRANYTFHGPYSRDSLDKLLKDNKINLICFTQIWPETYSYTLNEAVGSGIPVLTTNMGAGKDRVNKYRFGWVIDSFLPDDIADKIIEISGNVKEYNLAVKAVLDYKIKSISDMGNDYFEIYSQGVLREPEYKKLANFIKSNIPESGLNGDAQIELLRITSSLKWRLVNRIKLPVKLKSFLRPIYQKLKNLRRKHQWI